MQKFLFRLGLFTLITLGALSFVDNGLPFYWGNEGLSIKMAHVKQENFKYNTYFIGSSRFYRHIVPHVFDSLNVGKTLSFNLGYSATKPPETYYFLDHFLDIEQPNTKYIFVELGVIQNLETINRSTLRSTYYMKIKSWWLAAQCTWNNDKPGYTRNYSISYLNQLTKASIVRPALTFTPKEHTDILGKQKDGYYSLEAEMAFLGGNNEFSQRLKSFRSDTNILSKSVSRFNQEYQDLSGYVCQANLDRIYQLDRKAASKGIQIFWVKTPRSPGILALYNALDLKHKVDLGNPMLYPELYDAEESFDIGHLSKFGAVKFSHLLVEAFQQQSERISKE